VAFEHEMWGRSLSKAKSLKGTWCQQYPSQQSSSLRRGKSHPVFEGSKR